MLIPKFKHTTKNASAQRKDSLGQTMSTAIFNMAPITMPRFVPASSSNRGQDNSEHAMGQGFGQSLNSVGDHLDFDLLAEYLLEDTSAPAFVDSNFQTSYSTGVAVSSGSG